MASGNRINVAHTVPVSLALILTLSAPFYAVAQFGDLTKRLGGGSTSSLPDSKIAGGLKDALKVGTDKTVDLTGRPGGYLDNPAIKIGLPGNEKALDGAMRAAGMGPKLDEFEASMNHAAESAAPAAKQIFVNAILAMSFEDARKLLNGGDTSITTYFKDKTTGDLKTAFRPAVEGAMEKDGVTAQYDALMSKAPSIPFMKTQSLNVNDYVISKALDGLFYMLGQQEKKFAPTPWQERLPSSKRSLPTINSLLWQARSFLWDCVLRKHSVIKRTGAPCSPQRTWAEDVGAKPLRTPWLPGAPMLLRQIVEKLAKASEENLIVCWIEPSTCSGSVRDL